MKGNSTQIKPEENKNLQQKIEDRQILKQLLIELTEDQVQAQFSDRHFDRENEKIKLMGGGEISVQMLRDMQSVVAKQLQEYSPRYPMEYYKETFRLNGWQYVEGQAEKPWIVARYTNEIIYARFTKEVLSVLQHLNPITVMGVRMHKHFQWLTPEAQVLLDKFIAEAVVVMIESANWHEFRVNLFKKHGVSFQTSFFEKND